MGSSSHQSLHDCWIAAAPISGAPIDEYSKPKGYLDYYEKKFAPIRDLPLTIVEVGVFRGQFLETLGRYFPNSHIIEIEYQTDRVRFESRNVTLFQGDQGDAVGLEEIFRNQAPDGIDILIDDASHIGSLSKSLFDVAIRHLRSGGAYYIEDWGTGYLPDWPDGASFMPSSLSKPTESGFAASVMSHSAGMVGFVKSLVDYVGTPHGDGMTPIAAMSLWAGVVELIKA